MNPLGKECLKLFCIRSCMVLHGNFHGTVLARNVCNYFVYVFGITWKFPWPNRFGKENCLKLFCIRVWYHLEISMESFWQGMFATVFCIRVWYHIEISMESFWQRMFKTILYL